MQQGRRLFRKDLRPCFYSEVPVKLWLTTFFCWLVMASACMASPIHVRDFSSVIEVEGNGNVVITERLNVEIPHEGRFHGIYRDIPVISRWREQGAARIEILRVLLDGAERPPNDVEHRNGMVRVYQRDTEAVLAPGRHEFVLTYRMTGQIGMFGDNDELTWNVTGRGWESPVDEASCTVLCPEGAPFYGQKAWLGRPGSMAAEVEMSRGVRNNRQIMEFRTKRPVFPGKSSRWPQVGERIRSSGEEHGQTGVRHGASCRACRRAFSLFPCGVAAVRQRSGKGRRRPFSCSANEAGAARRACRADVSCGGGVSFP